MEIGSNFKYQPIKTRKKATPERALIRIDFCEITEKFTFKTKYLHGYANISRLTHLKCKRVFSACRDIYRRFGRESKRRPGF